MRKFFILVSKEIRELLTIQVLLPLIITILIFVFIGQVIGQEAEKAEELKTLSVIDKDKSELSKNFVSALEDSGYRVSVYRDKTKEQVIKKVRKEKENFLLIIPEGFEKSIYKGNTQSVEVYTVIRNFSFMGAREAGGLKAAVFSVSDALSRQLISSTNPPISVEVLKNPIKIEDHVIVGEKRAKAAPSEVLGFVTLQTTFIPIILTVVIIFASQMVATAIATEKENKTLETLLSLPVSRKSLAVAKMVAAGLVALLAALVYIFGFRYYMEGITGQQIGNLQNGAASSRAIQALGLNLTVPDYLLLGLSLFFGILCALAISLILGAFAENVKNVQALMTPLMIFILIPYFLVMFLDISTISEPLRWLVLAIPFSHPFLAAPNLFLGNYYQVIYGVLYQLAVFSVFVLIAGKIFSSDKILTMKLKLGKNRKKIGKSK